MKIPVAQLAWMAGIIDLRGRVTYKTNPNRKNSSQCTLYIETINMEIIERLCQLTGTSIEKKNRAGRPETVEGWYRKGCEEHCPEQHVHVAGFDAISSGRWSISGAGLVVVGEGIMPYLVSPALVQEAVRYARQYLVVNGRGAGSSVATLRRLDALGWKTPADIVEQRRDMFPWQHGNRLASYT